MKLIAILSHAALASCCLSLLASLSVPVMASSGLPAQVKVSLFSAQPNPERLILLGPCSVSSINGSRSFTLPPGRFQVSCDQSGDVCIQAGGAHPQVLAREKVLSIHANPSSCIRLEIGEGKSAGLKFHSHTGCYRYKGTLVVSSCSTSNARNALSIINIVPRREYLASVVASEMPRGAPLEALKAQSVLANTQTAKITNNQIIDGSTQLQSYGGAPESRPEAYDAVDQTGNLILKFENKPVQAFFHSTCAGMTSKPRDVFGGRERLPYLTNISCSYCRQSPFCKETTSSIPAAKFETIFGVSSPTVICSDPAGRPSKVKYQFAGKSVVSNGYQFWLKLGQSFGWDKAPGTKYSLSCHDREVFIKSTGAGHGVGMCQYGAIGMARQGKTFREILAFYFPGTRLSPAQVPVK